MMTGALAAKYANAVQIIRQMPSVLVAYSGGVDIALVLAIAHGELHDRALACIGVSPSYPQRELRDAVAFAKSLGARYRLVYTSEQHDRRYLENHNDRCYFCKSDLYARLRSLAQREGFGTILNGVHADDLDDHAHGIQAASENRVRSPLLEAGIQKDEVRRIAQALGLAVWDKPAMACLSSRIPSGTPITIGLLHQVELAEAVLADLDFRQFRVRHHGQIARIELPVDELPRAIEFREAIINGIRGAGYRFVTLDLAGFRSGLAPLETLIGKRGEG